VADKVSKVLQEKAHRHLHLKSTRKAAARTTLENPGTAAGQIKEEVGLELA